MRKKFLFIGVYLWVAASMGLVSCSEQAIPEGVIHNEGNNGVVEALGRLDVEDALSADKGNFILKIRTAGEWKVSVKDSWCSFVRYQGQGSTDLMGTVEKNDGTERTTVISLFVDGKTLSFDLRQSEKKDDANPTPNPESPSGYAAGLEIPKLMGGDQYLFVTHTTNNNGNSLVTYSYEWDCLKKHSRWVAFTFSAATKSKNVGRNDDFKEDEKIPSQYRTTLADYKSSGFSRGHLCASSDRQYSKEANRQTFLLSNMSPQIQNGFNGGIWMELESKVQSWGDIQSPKDTLYVAKGGTIREDQIKQYIGVQHDVPVPMYYFMAVLSLKKGKYQAVAFWLEHKDYGKDKNYAKYAVSVDELEQKTGIDFFHNLPDNIEKEVEASYDKSVWGL